MSRTVSSLKPLRTLPWWLAGAAFVALATVATVAWQAADRQRRDGEGALRQAASDAALRMLNSLNENEARELVQPALDKTASRSLELHPPVNISWFTTPGDPNDWIFGPWPQRESEASAAFSAALALHHAEKTAESRKALTAPDEMLSRYDALTPNTHSIWTFFSGSIKTYQGTGNGAMGAPMGVTSSGIPLGPLVLRHLMETAADNTERRTHAANLLLAAVINPSVLTHSLVEEAAGALAENQTSQEQDAIATARAAAGRIETLRRVLKEHRQEVIDRKPWIGREWSLTYPAITIGVPSLIVWSMGEIAEWLSRQGIGAPVPGLPYGWIFRARRYGVDTGSDGRTPGERFANAPAAMATKESGPWSVDVVARHPASAFASLDSQLSRQRWLIAGATGFMAAALGGFLFVLARQRRLNAMMSDFVASVSHELRAPVASMGLLAERLGDGRISGVEEQARYHKLLCGESRRISSTIENVLAFSRHERGRRLYEHELSDLTALLRDTADIVRPLVEERQVFLTVSLPERNVERELDAIAIRQAVLNLLDNALKFSPAGGTIKLSLHEEKGEVIITVCDEGPGIPVAERTRIFEPFYRIGSELRRETPGIGIGLAIVRDAALAHRGEVRVNGAEGQGAEFVLILREGNSNSVLNRPR